MHVLPQSVVPYIEVPNVATILSTAMCEVSALLAELMRIVGACAYRLLSEVIPSYRLCQIQRASTSTASWHKTTAQIGHIKLNRSHYSITTILLPSSIIYNSTLWSSHLTL